MTRTAAFERTSFAGRRVLVLGLGRFTGGLETVRFLRSEGADVLVSDRADPATLTEAANEALALGADVHFGRQTAALLEGRDALLVNPAVPFDHPVLTAAARRRIPATTEINVVLARSRAPVYGVTGTKGKSTTASLLARMLESTGRRVHLGGNIGRALVARLDTIEPEDRIVLELSSFQLWWCRRLGRSPSVTVITNLLSDHLDRHGTHAAYAEAKRAALDFQTRNDLAVLPADDEAMRRAGWFEAGEARRVYYGEGGTYVLAGLSVVRGKEQEPLADLAGMSLLGRHNRRNALAAAAAVLESGGGGARNRAAVRRGALSTRPLPHRLEPVAEVNGVLFVDDSNATHPESVRCALEALDRPVVLIAGGKDKGVDPAALFAAIREHAKAVVAVGSSAPHLLERLAPHLPVRKGEPDMRAAVWTASSLAEPGDVVLLSPGYSSLDQYASFAERGDRFAGAVRLLEASSS